MNHLVLLQGLDLPFPPCQVGQGVDSILVCMVLVRTQALFWGRRKNLKKTSPPLICEIKRTITNFFFFMWP
jgi:hypothetical protein